MTGYCCWRLNERLARQVIKMEGGIRRTSIVLKKTGNCSEEDWYDCAIKKIKVRGRLKTGTPGNKNGGGNTKNAIVLKKTGNCSEEDWYDCGDNFFKFVWN